MSSINVSHQTLTSDQQKEQTVENANQTDFYQILGVDENATYREIKKKYLKLSLLYHPDKCEGKEEMYTKINLAYKVLSNPENRRKYNQSLATTFNQFKDQDRDTEYHINQEFQKQEVDGTTKFDREKFLQLFEQQRSAKSNNQPEYFQENDQTRSIQPMTENQADTLTKVNQVDLGERLQQRSQDLDQFRQKQNTSLTSESHDLDQFNFVFSRIKELQRRDLQEVTDSQPAHQPFTSLDHQTIAPNQDLEALEKIDHFQSLFKDSKLPQDSEQTPNQNLDQLLAKVEEHRKHQESVFQELESQDQLVKEFESGEEKLSTKNF